MPNAHILVIDDHGELRQQLRRILEGDGYRVSLARSPREAARVGRSVPFDVVIVHDDIEGVDGVWALRMLRRTTRKPLSPAILITSSPVQRASARSLPRAVCLDKPFAVEDLLDAIEEVQLPQVFRTSSAPPAALEPSAALEPTAALEPPAALEPSASLEARGPATGARASKKKRDDTRPQRIPQLPSVQKLQDEAGRRNRHTPAYGGFYA